MNIGRRFLFVDSVCGNLVHIYYNNSSAKSGIEGYVDISKRVLRFRKAVIHFSTENRKSECLRSFMSMPNKRKVLRGAIREYLEETLPDDLELYQDKHKEKVEAAKSMLNKLEVD